MAQNDAPRQAESTDDVDAVRALFIEYAQWLNVDLCFQDFATELKTLPGAYAPPRGRLLLAGSAAESFGCVALRPLDGDNVGEVKRLFVRPVARNRGLGARLAQAIVSEARSIGYRELKLDTLETMVAARELYGGLGFRRCAPYYHNPLPGAIYMTLSL